MSLGPNDSPNNRHHHRQDLFAEALFLPTSYSNERLCKELQDFLSGAIKVLRIKMRLSEDDFMSALVSLTGRTIAHTEFLALIRGERILSSSQVDELAGALGVETKNVFQMALAITRNSSLSEEEIAGELQQLLGDGLNPPGDDKLPETE